jgi:hypothetical protein
MLAFAAAAPMLERQASAWTRRVHSDDMDVSVVSRGKLFVGATSYRSALRSAASRATCDRDGTHVVADGAVDGHGQPISPERVDDIDALDDVLCAVEHGPARRELATPCHTFRFESQTASAYLVSGALATRHAVSADARSTMSPVKTRKRASPA